MSDLVRLRLGAAQPAVEAALADLAERKAAWKIWDKDASLWKSDAETQEKIVNRLGWLTIGGLMEPRIGELEEFAQQVKTEGFTDVVLLGMGGSSLAPEVLMTTFGSAEGSPKLWVLDSTAPDTVARYEAGISLETTLFIVSSKSGGTIESNSFFKYFYEKVRAIRGDEAGRQFVAITDPGTSLERLAQEHLFRRHFSAPADVGGRYSALTYFGLAPGALIGARVGALLERAGKAAEQCSQERTGEENPGLLLGAAMGALAKEGRDKLTFLSSPEIRSFGYWVEQLVAESTGKEGVGVLPVEGEPIVAPETYGADRAFVYLRVHDSDDHSLDAVADALAAAGQPVITVNLADTLDLGAQFFLWEYATAIAGAALNINPFDEPNVKESKDNTGRILDEYIRGGAAPTDPAGTVTEGDFATALRNLTNSAQSGDYLAIAAFIDRTPETDSALEELRGRLLRATGIATTVGFGPRFLHSTGQLHKGGPNTGIFLQIVAEDSAQVEIPGEPFTFNILKEAQALGDFQSLATHGRRALRVRLGRDVAAGLAALNQAAAGLAGR